MRPIGEILHRGFDNTIANWPLILVSIAGQVAMVTTALLLLVLAIIPAVLMGIAVDWGSVTSDPEAFFENLILAHPFFVIYVLLAIGIILIPVMMLWAFLEGGKFGIYLDGERAGVGAPRRRSMRVFEPGRWLAWGRATWWRAFWVYNIVWALVFLVLLLFMLVIGALVFAIAMAGGEAAAPGGVLIGCFGLLVLIPLILLAAFISNMVTQLAMSLLVRDGGGAIEKLKAAMGFIRAWPGTVIGVTLVTIVVSIAMGGIFSVFGLVFRVGEEMNEAFMIAIIPLQLFFALLQAAISAALQCWVSATFVATVTGESGYGSSRMG